MNFEIIFKRKYPKKTVVSNRVKIVDHLDKTHAVGRWKIYVQKMFSKAYCEIEEINELKS